MLLWSLQFNLVSWLSSACSSGPPAKTCYNLTSFPDCLLHAPLVLLQQAFYNLTSFTDCLLNAQLVLKQHKFYNSPQHSKTSFTQISTACYEPSFPSACTSLLRQMQVAIAQRELLLPSRSLHCPSEPPFSQYIQASSAGYESPEPSMSEPLVPSISIQDQWPAWASITQKKLPLPGTWLYFHRQEDKDNRPPLPSTSFHHPIQASSAP